MSGKGGRPKAEFTPEQLDRAKFLLGRNQYPSRVAGRLRRRFGLSVAGSYRLIDAARRQVFEALRSENEGLDPLSATYLFLQSVMADAREDTGDRIAAATAIIRLLGLHKLTDRPVDADQMEDFLAGLMARRMARAAAELDEGEDREPAGG